MEKSDHYYRRKQYMKNLQVPTISEVKRELGEHLAEALLSRCPDPLKPDMGLTPLLKGAGDDLWISPSDILIGKVCLKPPLTNKHIKALTHQGILMIGQDVETKFRNEAEIDKKTALKEQEEMLTFIAELDKRKDIETARKEEQQKCEEEKEQMRIEFEARLQHELAQLENLLEEEYELLMRRQKEELDDEWQQKLEAAVTETVTRLTEQFLKDLEAQEKELLRKFGTEIKKEQIKRKIDIKHTEECCQETFSQLKHQLECKNIANIMYILCMERRKCQSEREHMEADYQKQVLDLQAVVIEKEVEITKLTKNLDEKIKQVNLREECILEILRQFQKFINFALRASPTQAEFLLSTEKMMTFELARAIAKTDERHAKRLAKTLFPWKKESESTITTLSFKESFKSLVANDHHECYNETEPPQSDHSLTSTDYLPGFHYDTHMYVREEFRNMMSQGIKISPSNLIWNRDVEHLMQILRHSVTSIEEEEMQEKQEKEEEPGQITKEEAGEEEILKQEKRDSSSSEFSFNKRSSSCKKPLQPPRRSVVYFRKSDDNGDFLFPIFESTSALNTTSSDLYKEMSVSQPVIDSSQDTSMILDKECCKPCVIVRPVDQYNMSGRDTALPLIGTKNSLELLKEPPTPQSKNQDSDHEGMGILCAQDSLLKHRMSLKPTNVLLSSRESIQIPDFIALGKRSLTSQRSSSKISINHERPEDPEKNLLTNRQPSIRKTSRDSKIQFTIKVQPSVQKNSEKPSVQKDWEKPLIQKDSEELKRRPSLDEEDIYKMSKLSLTRDSFFVHKRSLILKRQASKSSQETLTASGHTASHETIQLKKPVKAASAQYCREGRSLLKKSSKSHMSNEIQSYNNLSANTSKMSRSQKDLGSPKELPVQIPTSKLTLSRDSLEVIRSHSKLSEINSAKQKADSKESIEIKDGILGTHLQGAQLSPIIKLEDNGSRTVKMSHIEIVPLEDRPYHPGTEVPEDESSASRFGIKTDNLGATDSPWLVYHDKEPSAPDIKPQKHPRDNFLNKPNVAHVTGDTKATEYLQKNEEFTIHRASSLLSIFRKHPSLVKMFTSCTK